MITRRHFFKTAGAAGAWVLGAGALAACGQGRGTDASDSEASTAEVADSTADEAASTSDHVEASPSDAAAADAIVIYFSRAGENYGVGVVEQGNTAVLVEMIAAKTGSDLFEISPEVAYPEGYDECCDVALDEQGSGARPAYVGDVDLASYKTVYLGYPIWWGDLPMCVYTFLEAHDWADKNILPFCTHAGSGVSGTDGSIANACAGATVGSPLAMAGTTAQNDRAMAESDVDAWLG